MKKMKKKIRYFRIMMLKNWLMVMLLWMAATIITLEIIVHFDLGLNWALLSPLWAFIPVSPLLCYFAYRAEIAEGIMKDTKHELHKAKRRIDRAKYLAEKAKKESSI